MSCFAFEILTEYSMEQVEKEDDKKIIEIEYRANESYPKVEWRAHLENQLP